MPVVERPMPEYRAARAAAAPARRRGILGAPATPAVGAAIQEARRHRRARLGRERLYRGLLAAADLLAAAAGADDRRSVVLGDDSADTRSCSRACRCSSSRASSRASTTATSSLIRKTTIDEAPQLFQLATLYTLVIWLLDDVARRRRARQRRRSLVLWVLLFALRGRSARYAARALAGRARDARALPVHRRRRRVRRGCATKLERPRSTPSSSAGCRCSASPAAARARRRRARAARA